MHGSVPGVFKNKEAAYWAAKAYALEGGEQWGLCWKANEWGDKKKQYQPVRIADLEEAGNAGWSYESGWMVGESGWVVGKALKEVEDAILDQDVGGVVDDIIKRYEVRHNFNTPDLLVVDTKTGESKRIHIDDVKKYKGDYSKLFREESKGEAS